MNQERPLNWIVVAVAGLLLFGLYGLTSPVNHSESNDGYEAAKLVEHTSLIQLRHSQHLIYLPAAKLLFTLSSKLGLAERAFPVMVCFSRICGVLGVLAFAALLNRRFAETQGDSDRSRALRIAAWAGTGGLAFSYGFWRYSDEAEIYTPAILLILLAWLATVGRPTLRNAILSGALGALSCLMHILNVVPTFAAIPLYYATQRRIRHACAHTLVAGVLTGSVYLAIYGTHLVTELFGPRPNQPEGGFHAKEFAKAVIGLTQDVTAGNFLFSLEKFQSVMVHIFPYRAFVRQIYTGQHADFAARTVPFVTLALLAATGLALLTTRVKLWRDSRPPRHTPDPALAAAVTLWLGLHTFIVLLNEPGNPENWVMALPPLWLLITLWLYAPVTAARPALPAVVALLLLAHNYFGGMHLLANPRGDYISCKAEWLLRNAGPDDLIITAESDEFVSYLTYFSRSQIVDLIYAVARADKNRWLTDLRSHKRRVFATAEVFQPLPSMKFRFPEQSAFINELGRDLAPDFVRIASNEFGGVFERVPALDAPRN